MNAADTQGNATVKVNGARVFIIDTDLERKMYRVRHLDGGVGWGRMDAITPDKRMIDAITGDDLLSALATIAPANRYRALEAMGVTILREAADLCGVDAVVLSKRQAIKGILDNF